MGLFSFITKPFKKVASWFKGSSSKVDYGSAISGLGSSALNMASSEKGLRDQFYYNTQLQKQAQNWSTQMASTAHQIEVNDMRKAGLNPILSATGGSGASAPGATGGSVGMPDYNLGEGISTALQFRQQKNNNKVADATASQLDDLGANLRSQTRGQAWKNLQEQYTYDNIQPLQKDLINMQILDYKNQIENRDANTAAIINRYKTMNLTDVINAYANRTSATSSAYKNNVESIGIGYDNKKRANDALYYGSGVGKRTQVAKEFVKSIPLVGKFAY
jgi:hypothetical protein